MKPEIEKLEICMNREKETFELKLDGMEVQGVKGFELKSLENGEPELKLTLNIKDFIAKIE